MLPSQLTECESDLETTPARDANGGATPVSTLQPSFDDAITVATQNDSGAAGEPACEKCHTPLVGKQGWCRRCGWYPRLRTFVELDPWDREDIPQPKPPSTLETCKKLVPAWAWMLMGGVVGVLVLSAVMRQILPPHGGYRFAWTIGQMLLGMAIFCGAHLSCYLFAMMHNDRMQVLDILLKPLTIWLTVLRDLPATFWRVAAGLWAVTAIFGGLIVGGLADKDLLDWGGTPTRYNLTKAIADRAQQLAADARTEKTLQESVEDFAGKAADAQSKEDPQQSGKPKLPVDCLIVGYTPLGDDDFRSLILAAELGGKLEIVGTVSDGITPEMRAQLNKRLRELRQPNPFIPCKFDGKWIRPALVCKIKAKRWSNDHRLVEPVFEEMLVDVDVQKG